MRKNVQKALKLSLLAITLMVGFSLINALQVQALTIADQNGIPSACPSKQNPIAGGCTVFINSITVNGFNDNDTSYTARTTPVPYGRLIPGQTITISWTDNSGSNVNNYIVKYGCGDNVDLANDDYTISYPVWPKSTTWTVPSTNYKYCKLWVYAKGIEQSYQPTLGVSNTRAFEMQAPQTCAPYQTTPCTTSQGCPGTQTCNYNGTAWGSCLDTPNDNCPPLLNCSITNFSANPTDVNSGGFTYLTWNTNGYCNSCTASANPYNASWTGIENTAGGTQPITNLIQTTTFTLNCSGSANTDTKNVTVTVQTPPPIRYSCNTSTYQCYQAVFGTYARYNDCVSACQPPVTKYSCNSNYQCVVDPNGAYTSPISCQNNCVAPAIRYSCNTSTYQCYQAVFGTYARYNDCVSACQPPVTKYSCNANYQCVVATNGEYTSLSTCQANCVAPAIRYSCNTSTYQCYQAVFGTYARYNDCVSACQPIIQPLSVSCYASPNYAQVNQTVTFYSNVSGGNGSYTYYWSGYASGNGSYSQTTFSSSGTYSANLTVYDSGGRSGSASCSINVQGQSILTPTLTFWADDYTLSQGDSTYLRWASNNANYCVASNGWSGTRSTSNYESTAPNSQTTYTLTCYGNGGQITQSLTLYVASPTTTINFIKLGRNLSNGDRVYSKVIRVVQGDIIEFYFTVTAGSANDLSNVVITDNLPSVFSYMAGTTKINGVVQADTIATTGLSLGTISRGTSKTITFQALSNNPGTYFTYTNTAQVTASGISALSDSATITFSSVLGAATVATGAEDSLLISLLMSIGLAFLVWYYVKFNPQGKLVLARIENKIRDIRLEYLRRQIKR